MYENSYLLKVDVIEERKSTHSRYEESRFVKSLKYYVKSSKCMYIRDNIQRFQHNYTHCRRCHFFLKILFANHELFFNFWSELPWPFFVTLCLETLKKIFKYTGLYKKKNKINFLHLNKRICHKFW